MIQDLDYLSLIPEVYGKIEEYRHLGYISDTLTEKLKVKLKKIEQGSYIKTADSESLAKMEEDFGIKSKPNETLQFRRDRLLTLKSDRGPYNIIYLQKAINRLTGSTANKVWTDVNDRFVLYVDVQAQSHIYMAAVNALVDKITPLNVSLFVAAISILETFLFRTGSYRFPVTYDQTGDFSNSEIHGGLAISKEAQTRTGSYRFPVTYDQTGDFTNQSVPGGLAELPHFQPLSFARYEDVFYPRTGELECATVEGGETSRAVLGLDLRNVNFEIPYPRTGILEMEGEQNGK